MAIASWHVGPTSLRGAHNRILLSRDTLLARGLHPGWIHTFTWTAEPNSFVSCAIGIHTCCVDIREYKSSVLMGAPLSRHGLLQGTCRPQALVPVADPPSLLVGRLLLRVPEGGCHIADVVGGLLVQRVKPRVLEGLHHGRACRFSLQSECLVGSVGNYA